MTDNQIDWFSVHEFVAPVLARTTSWPTPGTTAWQQLADDDPVKWCAVLDLGVQMALRLDTEQSEKNKAMAEAAQQIAGAADWSAVAHRVQYGPGPHYIPRQKAS